MIDVPSLKLSQLRTYKEERLFAVMMLFAVSTWLAIVITVVGLVYALLIGLFVIVAHQLFLAYVRGNAVRVSTTQLPELYARVQSACARLGLREVPEVYVMQAGGTLNAMATKLFSRKFVIVYSDLVDACGEDGAALDFVIGHEVGHLALGHLKWRAVLAPMTLMPLLGSAYSRACEYSCDRCGLAVVGALDGALRGLSVLAVGGKLARSLRVSELITQAKDTTGFWPAVFELNATHPFIVKRVRYLKDFVEPGTAPELSRSALSYPLAPILGLPAAGLTGGGGTAMGVLMVIFMIGILSAVAVPKFLETQRLAKTQEETALTLEKQLQEQAAALEKHEEAKALVLGCRRAQEAHFAKRKRYAVTFAKLGLTAAGPTYGLYMGKEHLGPELNPPDELRGGADKKGYACVAVGNLDEDENFDVWYINTDSEAPIHFRDDQSDADAEQPAQAGAGEE